MLARMALQTSSALTLAVLALAFAWVRGIDAETAVEWVLHPALNAGDGFLLVGLVILVVPLTLVSQCLSMRAPWPAQSRPASSADGISAYIRVWLKMGILDSASDWLNGTLLWRVWLRAAGMTIGKNTELSTIFDTVPELVEIGAETFLADGVYLGGPQVPPRHGEARPPPGSGDGVFLEQLRRHPGRPDDSRRGAPRRSAR